MNYLIWTNLYLTLFYAFYWVSLRKETLFNLNRWYFLGAAAVSIVLPAIDFTNMMTVVPTGLQSDLFLSELPAIEVGALAQSSGFPVWLSFYIAGCLLSLVWLIYRFIAIHSSFKVPVRGAAYSFLSSIYVDDSLPAHDKMLRHERVHAEQLHSIDIVLFEIVRVVLWFNPVIHLWIRAVKLNHEYIADRASAVDQEEKIHYATVLLQQNLGASLNNLANNFFNKPFLKKRIAMLFKNQSKKSVAARLLLLIPVMIISFALQSARPASTAEAGLTSNPAIAQDTAFTKVDVSPSPVGGFQNFYNYVGQNYKYPKAAVDAKVEGRLIIQFVVEKDGSLVEIKSLKDLGHGTGEEAVRMLESAPKWNPGLLDGKPVRVQFTLPIQLNKAEPSKEEKAPQS
jgi:hypothetical protein